MIKYNIEAAPYKLVLASASPRRIEMFRNHEIFPEILPAEAEEQLPRSLSMEQSVMYLALEKAREVEKKICARQPVERCFVVAADTVVYKERIIGKPADEAEAVKILEELRGQQHFVATGVAVIEAGTGNRRVFHQVSGVWFKDYSRQQILDYVATGEPMDKAGGYAIQGAWGVHVDHYEGDYHNIIGFPWGKFQEEFVAMVK